jgi:hypothetical protein
MTATISKNLNTNKFEVRKWDNNHNVIETFTSKKRSIASEIFIKWYFNRKE